MGWAGNVARLGDRIGAYRVLMGRPEGKKQLGKLSHGWEDNKNRSSRRGIGGIVWIDLAQDRVRWRAFVNTVTNLRAA
jgi:hypothetical protein